MKKSKWMLTMLLGFLLGINAAIAQTTLELSIKKHEKPSVEKLLAQKEHVNETEKELLKKEVEKINRLLKEGELTEEEADTQKKLAAEKRAKNIEDQHKIIDAKIDLLKCNEYDENDAYYYNEDGSVEWIGNLDEDKPKFRKTFGQLIVGVGFSNVIGDDISYGDLYKVGGSRFFELGYEWTTGLTANNLLRVNYGVNLQFNGLKPKDNKIFEKDGDQVILADFPEKVKKSKLRMDNLVIPIHLEIAPSNNRGYSNGFKLGLGGYAGLNLRTIHKLKYKADGYRIKAKSSFSSQTEDLVYGLSGYIGCDWIAFYAKYDLNPIFRNNEKEERMLNFGVRMMF